VTDFDLTLIRPGFPNIPLLEPKVVSSWLGIPGSQLPRETMKIIGQPKQPAKKKGGSARYSGEDAVLMKLGRKLLELGITPHRVQICVNQVRRLYPPILEDGYPYYIDPDAYEWIQGPFYLVGRETSTGFHAEIVVENELTQWLTQSGLELVEKRMNLQVKLYRSTMNLHARYPELEGKDFTVFSGGGEDHLKTSAGSFDPASPAIIQNVTRFLQENHLLLFKHCLAFKSRTV
jgi:hypothetical protein